MVLFELLFSAPCSSSCMFLPLALLHECSVSQLSGSSCFCLLLVLLLRPCCSWCCWLADGLVLVCCLWAGEWAGAAGLWLLCCCYGGFAAVGGVGQTLRQTDGPPARFLLDYLPFGSVTHTHTNCYKHIGNSLTKRPPASLLPTFHPPLLPSSVEFNLY